MTTTVAFFVAFFSKDKNANVQRRPSWYVYTIATCDKTKLRLKGV